MPQRVKSHVDEMTCEICNKTEEYEAVVQNPPPERIAAQTRWMVVSRNILDVERNRFITIQCMCCGPECATAAILRLTALPSAQLPPTDDIDLPGLRQSQFN